MAINPYLSYHVYEGCKTKFIRAHSTLAFKKGLTFFRHSIDSSQ